MLKNKKVICIMLIVCLSILLVSCGQENEQKNNNIEDGGQTQNQNEDTKNEQISSKLFEEPVTFTMLYNGEVKSDWLVLEEIKKATNVVLDIQGVPSSDYSTKRQLVINSGNMPDIFGQTSVGDVADYVLQGLFLPISDYLDQMPNFKKFLEEYDYDLEIYNMTEADGKFYGVPVKAYPMKLSLRQWLIRTDLFEKHNIPIPETMEDIYEAGKILKEAYPDSYPIINRFGSGNILSRIAPAFGVKAGWGLTNSGFMYDEENDNWYFVPATEEYKAMLEYCHKLLKDGILDPEFTTLDSSVYEERVVNSETFILADWLGNELRYNLNGKKINPDFNVDLIYPPKGPGGYAIDSAQKYEHSWVISASVKDKDYFDKFIKFLDWLYTEEAAVITTFGAEGETYEIVDGKYVYTDAVMSSGTDLMAEYGIYSNNLNVRVHDDWFAATKSERVTNIYNKMINDNVIPDMQPKIRLNIEEKETEKLYSSTLVDYVNKMTEKFIYGEESFDNWDSFVNECKAKGADKLGELYNKVWKKQN